jgi:homogentisate 1,2-dioxygenase
MATHVYNCNASMVNTSFCNADGDLLIVPSTGELFIRTEFGCMTVPVGFIAVVQRGINFAVFVKGPSRGYIAELFESHFVIPDLGPIGSNGLAMPKHFETVTASFEDVGGDVSGDYKFKVVQKFLGKLFSAERNHSIFNVVGWVGNYLPFRYDLSKFNVVGSISYDHLDPCTFTVLTAQTAAPGVACLDFVVFPPRWKVHMDTFRPPYYHKNIMTEYLGVISGEYEVREGFVEGAGSLHSCMTPHGPDSKTFEGASTMDLVVEPPSGGYSFMFESTYIFRVAPYFLRASQRDVDYVAKNWVGFKKHYTPTMSKL